MIQESLAPDSGRADYASAARALDVTEGAVRMAVFRLRRRYAELFREEVAHTVESETEIEDEMRALLSVLSG